MSCMRTLSHFKFVGIDVTNWRALKYPDHQISQTILQTQTLWPLVCQIMVSLLLLTNIKIDKKVEIYSWSVSRWTPRPEALNRTMLCMKWLATSDQEKFLVRPSPICVIRPIGLPGPKDARDFRSRITTLAINPPLLLVAVVVCLMNRKWQVVCNNTSNKLYNIPNVRRSILHLLRNNCKDMFITYLNSRIFDIF